MKKSPRINKAKEGLIRERAFNKEKEKGKGGRKKRGPSVPLRVFST
jgi:hypothetical protein